MIRPPMGAFSIHPRLDPGSQFMDMFAHGSDSETPFQKETRR